MTDLTDEALDKLVARLHDDGLGFGIGPALLSQSAAAVITALRQREATAGAGAIEAAASMTKRIADGYNAGGDAAIGCGLYLTAGNIRSLHTDATRAALDRVRAEGMREAAAWHEERAKDEDALSSKYRGGSNPWFAHVQMAKIHRDSASAILAAADKLEGKP